MFSRNESLRNHSAMKILLLIVLLPFGAFGLQQRITVCSPVPPDFSYPKSPQVYVLEPRRVGMLRGKVTGPRGAEITGPVLVEIIRGSNDERRVAACFADQDGSFDFGRKKKGRYYLKISMGGFDTAYIQVEVGKSKKKDLTVELQLST